MWACCWAVDENFGSRQGHYVKAVQPVDAHVMTFADATFDCVVAQFVITLVADRVLSECRRMVKPGRRIITLACVEPMANSLAA